MNNKLEEELKFLKTEDNIVCYRINKNSFDIAIREKGEEFRQFLYLADGPIEVPPSIQIPSFTLYNIGDSIIDNSSNK